MEKSKLSYTVCFALLFTFVTIHWMHWDAGISLLSVSDVASGYELMAKEAPSFPGAFVGYHKAQRFYVPYFVGSLSMVTKIPYRWLFYFFTSLVFVRILVQSKRTLRLLGLAPETIQALLLLIILNPYTIRYYMIIPGMLGDLIFISGMLDLIQGLLIKNWTLIFLGGALSGMGRQTVLTLLPGIGIWLNWIPKWRKTSFYKRNTLLTIFIALLAFLYFLPGMIWPEKFSATSGNAYLLGDMIKWILSPEFRLYDLCEYLMRTFIPLLISGVLILWIFATHGIPKKTHFREFWCLLLFAAGIVGQPLLAGPLATLNNASRLSALAIPPMVFAVGALIKSLELEQKLLRLVYLPKIREIALAILLVLSLHHIYTRIGPFSPLQFTLVQVLGTLAFVFTLQAGTRKV